MELIKLLKSSIYINRLSGFIIKLITSISIFTLTVFFTPNFNIISLPILILSSFIITLLDNLVNLIIDKDNIAFEKCIIGFTIATAIIYITQYFVEGYYISVISSIIAGGIYGIIASMLKSNIYY